MATEFYVTVEGTKQGKFKGESVRRGREGTIPGISFHYNVSSPRDSGSGMATGKRTHQPVSFVKEWGPSTPQFFQALCTNEVLKSVLFEFVTLNAAGREHVNHSVELTNVTVSEIDQYLGESSQGATPDPRALERISLTFQRIQIENKDAKTMAVDDWSQPA